MASVLVTGAAGFVGSHLIELLEHDPAEIVGWLRPGTQPMVRGTRVKWVDIELHEREAVESAIASMRPTAVYHLAGVPHIGDSWGHTHETFAGNVLGTHNVLAALRRTSLRPRILITSSASVYHPIDRAMNEDDVVRPNSPYGTSKLAQEMVAVRAWEDDGIPALIARSFNHVGPRQTPAFVASSIAKQIAEIEAGTKPAVLAMGNLDSERDIMDVRDTVRAYHAMMATAKPGIPYNVCSGVAVPIRTLVELMRSKARVPITIEQDRSRFRPNDTPLVLGDHARLTADTGWSPRIPLAQTVEDMLSFWRRATA
jgi:GDP-4-dehydro-6-deoxy-D-mannose reductase